MNYQNLKMLMKDKKIYKGIMKIGEKKTINMTLTYSRKCRKFKKLSLKKGFYRIENLMI